MPFKALLALGAGVLALTSVQPDAWAAGDRVRSIELTADTKAANPNANQAAYLLADMWKKLGLDVKVKEVPYKQKLDVVYFDRSTCEGAACFDLAMWSIVGRPERSDPDEVIYNLFHSSTGAKGYNYPGYANPDYDKAAAGQQVETDQTKRRELVFKAQEIQANDPSYVFFVNPIVNYAIRKDVFDEKTVVEQSGLGILNFWTHTKLTPIGAKKDIILNTSDNLLNLVPMAIGGAAASWITDLVWDRMLRISPKGLPEPWAAESYKWVDDKTIDVTLRTGMKWHDGKPVTVDDVMFTFGEVKAMAPMYAPFLDVIAKVETTGERTVRMHLKNPSAPFLTSTLAKVNLTPAHIWRPVVKDLQAKGQNLDSYQPDELIGSGPYKFVHWRRNAEVLLAANKDHWSPPKAEHWILRIVPNLEATLGMMKQGEINFLSEYRGDFETLQQVSKESGNIAIKSGVTIGVEYMGFNLKRKPMNDTAFRRALSLATDRNLLAASAWSDQAVPTNSIVSTVLDYWHNPAVAKGMFDLEKAKQMLTAAGYSWVGGRLHYPDGVKDTVMATK
ncbi:MAG: twin-arginine translocation pathway signal protein [Alphaproteobacteria bacterium]|nr:twin-arginine translocation pathway signal protein [Alphaproteobacteria bacterium]